MTELRIQPRSFILRISQPDTQQLAASPRRVYLRMANRTVVTREAGNIITVTAGASLGGHRAVVIDSGVAQYADSTTTGNATRVVGLTKGAITSGTSGEVQTYGELVEPSFAWTAGEPIYLGTNGQLTQTVPTSGFILQVAIAITATKIFIKQREPILIS